jgi:hypothetical protein
VFSDKKIFEISANENTLWALAAMNQTWHEWSLGGQLSKLCPVTSTSIQDGHRQQQIWSADIVLT